MSTEMIDKLFLELSLVTTATTAKELTLMRRVDAQAAQLKEFDNLTDELTKGIGAASCINPVTDMRNAVAKVRDIIFKPFEKRDTLGMLYEAWDRLPASQLMGVIGAAIQDLQYHQEELVRIRQQHNIENERLRVQVDGLMKALAAVEAVKPPAPIIIA